MSQALLTDWRKPDSSERSEEFEKVAPGACCPEAAAAPRMPYSRASISALSTYAFTGHAATQGRVRCGTNSTTRKPPARKRHERMHAALHLLHQRVRRV